jgi:large subunit ribosomal protein L3
MGVERVTTQNLTVHSVDAAKSLILIKGAVPGATNSIVFIRSAAKKAVSEHATKAGA